MAKPTHDAIETWSGHTLADPGGGTFEEPCHGPEDIERDGPPDWFAVYHHYHGEGLRHYADYPTAAEARKVAEELAEFDGVPWYDNIEE